MFRQSPEQAKANELIAARTDLSPKLKAQYLIENFIQLSWLGPEADGNVKARFASQIVDTLDGAGVLAAITY